MPTKEMSVEKSDLVLWASAALALLIVSLSVWWLVKAPIGQSFSKDQFGAYKEIYQLVVKETLMPLLTLTVGAKVTFVAAKIAFNKLSDK